jgi:arylsulfatase
MQQAGGIRPQFCHVIDIAPTILEAAGVAEPTIINGVAQTPIEGTSMVYSFADPRAPERHTTQYFELIANRGIYHDGWLANTAPKKLPWAPPGLVTRPEDFEWELYHVADDFSQADNLAAKHPEKLAELKALFDVEARKYDVFPLDSTFAERADVRIRPSLTRGRDTFTYYPGTFRVPEGSAPDLKNRSYAVSAEVEIPPGGAEGVLVTQGGRFGGWGLLVIDGKPEFVHAYSNQKQHKYRVASAERLPPGKHTIVFDFAYEGPGMGKAGTGTLSVDGKQVAAGRIEKTIPLRISLDETFDVGRDTGTPVVEEYVDRMPFAFNGRLGKVVIRPRDDGPAGP